MTDSTTTASQVLPSSGAFDTPRTPAPEGTYEATVTCFSDEPSKKGDSYNQTFTVAPVNGARGLAFARINYRREWFDPTTLSQYATLFREYTTLPRNDQQAFAAQNKEAIRAGIALRQVNRVAAYLGLVDSLTGLVNWEAYLDEVQNITNGQPVRVRVQHTDINGLTRAQAKKQGLDFDEETIRAEATFLYPKGWRTA